MRTAVYAIAAFALIVLAGVIWVETPLDRQLVAFWTERARRRARWPW
jgi:hypothetical protein